MGLVIVATFAACLWLVLYSIGVKSFDGALLALVIVIVAAGLQALKPRRAGDGSEL